MRSDAPDRVCNASLGAGKNARSPAASSDSIDRHPRFGTVSSLWSVIDRATDPNTHPKASGDYDPWRRPDPRREYVLSVAFANQIGDAIMIRGADARRRRNRSGGRYATGARA